MKYRESGMPDEKVWTAFFDPIHTLRQLGVNECIHTLLDIGCGYGTFLIPASGLITGTAIGIDIDETMLQTCKQKAREQENENIRLLHGDITTAQTINDLKNQSPRIDYIAMFNILHCEHPPELLNAAYHLLSPQGKAGVIHWIHGNTPRGPSMNIRPTPEMICAWFEKAGFILEKHHYL